MVSLEKQSEKAGVAADVPALHVLSKEVSEHAAAADKALHKIDADELSRASRDGLSFLELKNHIMLEYLSNLTYVALRKASGKAIAGDVAVERIVEARTVLEKMRPLEQKLKYQMTKAVRAAEDGEVALAADPLRFRADPSALVSKLGEDDDDDEEDEGGEGDGKEAKKKTGKYVAPKNVPTYYDGDKTQDDAEEEETRRIKKRQLSKGLIEDLKRQHLDAPEEVHEREGLAKRKHIDAMRERVRYEEDNFMRLPVPKKAKISNRGRAQMSTMGTIGDEVASFGLSYFSDKKKKGVGGAGKRKGGKGKKKRFK